MFRPLPGSGIQVRAVAGMGPDECDPRQMDFPVEINGLIRDPGAAQQGDPALFGRVLQCLFQGGGG